MSKISKKKIKRRFNKRSRKRLSHKGGAPVLPSEYFGKNSGRYTIENGTPNPDAVSQGMPNSVGSMGPKLSPYPVKFNQAGGDNNNDLMNILKQSKETLLELKKNLDSANSELKLEDGGNTKRRSLKKKKNKHSLRRLRKYKRKNKNRRSLRVKFNRRKRH